MVNILINKVKWSFRRFAINIPKDALVLEVGSGGNPYPRSNVLVDAYEETRERHWEKLIADRPTVIAFGEKLPFKNKSFDFVIAAHVLEHTSNPKAFLSELERVSKNGYIETPDAFMERINPYKDHRCEVSLINGSLSIKKKTSWVMDRELVDLYEKRAKKIITRQTIPQNPEEFHVRYFWKDRIKFNIINPQDNSAWVAPKTQSHTNQKNLNFKSKLRLFVLFIFRKLFSQSRRNNKLDISEILKCECGGSIFKSLKTPNKELICKNCNKKFKKNKNIFYFN